MNLTEKPEIVNWPETVYVYVEKVGPFSKTAPQAWQEVLRFRPSISEHAKITGNLSLYKVESQTYRAGFALTSVPVKLTKELQCEKFQGGKYSRFVLTGPWSDLPAASGRVFEIVKESKLKLRDDFCIENYVSDPQTTPEDKLITEILIPTA
jgi:DNA gyrase inhibitor GyrI